MSGYRNKLQVEEKKEKNVWRWKSDVEVEIESTSSCHSHHDVSFHLAGKSLGLRVAL